MFYCESCRVKKNWPKGLVTSHGACEVCAVPACCYDVPSGDLPKPKGETVETAQKISPPARPSSEEQLQWAKEMLEHRDKLALLRKEQRELEETIADIDSKYRAAHDALADTGRIGTGDSAAFQVGDRVVTVLGQPTGSSIVRVMPLTVPATSSVGGEV